jgi:benzoylformate decarboxylase
MRAGTRQAPASPQTRKAGWSWAHRLIAMDIVDPAIDFPALAASMGLPARRVERAADIAPAIEAGISSGVPNLIEIPITPA